MGRIRVAVIGAGHQGRYHADKYAQHPDGELVAIVDPDEARARALAERHGVRALRDHRGLLGALDAVSIATPAPTHLPIARDCLAAGIDVLVEKPIALDVDEADQMIALAQAYGRVLQVGHLERFNPVMLRLEQIVHRPLFIECHRIAPFKARGTDVDVLLDLMIHDIDLAMGLVGTRVVHVEAMGAPVLSDLVDIANARVHFDGGCVANITASRISLKSERKMRFFQRDGYISADFQNRQLSVARRVAAADGSRTISHEVETLEGDALALQIDAFLASVRSRGRPKIDGLHGRRALEEALRIRAALDAASGSAGAEAAVHAVH